MKHTSENPRTADQGRTPDGRSAEFAGGLPILHPLRIFLTERRAAKLPHDTFAGHRNRDPFIRRRNISFQPEQRVSNVFSDSRIARTGGLAELEGHSSTAF